MSERHPNASSSIGRQVVDLKGQRFGRLVALEFLGVLGEHAVWHCLCDCEEAVDVPSSRLRQGRTRSCGCLRRERMTTHGGVGTPTYGSWSSMIKRCSAPEDAHHHQYYAARGITVCERWRDGEGGRSGFECFLADMGERPPGKTIERRNNDGNYEPGNCHWATMTEQAANRRSPRKQATK